MAEAPYRTIEAVEEEFRKVYLIEDEGVIRILLATIIANRLGIVDKPIWLLLVAGSAGGKTAFLDSTLKCGSWMFPIDTLTVNTFASGLQRAEDVSLLHKTNGGILVFKDFTTLTSMNEDGLREIMGQLRAIYDGSFRKETGNDVTVDWKGKIGIIAAGTDAAQRKMRLYSEQGERFINYHIKQPDPVEVTRRAIKNKKGIKDMELHLQDVVAEFVGHILNTAITTDFALADSVVNDMVDAANFATLARSPVIMDRKTGRIEFVPNREMPGRVAVMLTNLVGGLMLQHKDQKLDEISTRTLYRVAFDSIPVDRRLVLQILAKYRSASTKMIAVNLNYPTETVREWCMQLNALKIIDRNPGVTDTWILRDKYKEVVQKFEYIKGLDEDLNVSEQLSMDETDATDDGWSDDKVDESMLADVNFGDL